MSEIYQLTNEFNQDKRENKINGTIGVIVDDNGKPYVLPVVKKVIEQLKFDNFNYLPIEGDTSFLNGVKQFLGLTEHNIQATVGGTNALYLWSRLMGKQMLIIREQTWENHFKIFYNYYLEKWTSFKELKQAMINYPDTPALFQIVHNPTGDYFTKSQWRELARLKNPVLFDVAYLGLGKGIDDFYPIKLFKNADVVISYSKIMTLYQHRVGALLTKRDWDMKGLFREINSSPPAFGQLIASKILNDDKLVLEWFSELHQMKEMINRRRELLDIKGKGLFSLLPLSKEEIEELKKDHAIYLLSNGRINFGGITSKDIKRIKEVL